MVDATALAHQTWVLTGAEGRIGRRLRPALAERVGVLRVVDRLAPEPLHPREQPAAADLRDPAAVAASLTGADGVLHLGGLADETDFRDLAQVNIVGTYHVLEGARRAGVRRVLYASSNHVTGLYPAGVRVDVDMPVRPDSLYGVSKVAGEALGRLYAEKFALEVVSLRIASFEERPRQPRHLSTWLSPDDALRAVLAAMTAPGISYAVFYVVSANEHGYWDPAAGEALGFQPRDAAELTGLAPPGPTEPQGGEYAAAHYTLERQEPDRA